MPTVYSLATRSMIALARVIARGQCLAEQVLDVEHLDVALAHACDELVVLPLRPFDPQDVVEQELVVGARASGASGSARAGAR